MKLEWMGQHRAAVEAIIRYGNCYAQSANLQGLVFGSVVLSSVEMQVMEYILENEERRDNMSQIAARLDLSQSNFSKIAAQLVNKGLLEKYRTNKNRKNIIVLPTPLAREIYAQYSVGAAEVWRPIFAELEAMAPGDEAHFIGALNAFTEQIIRARELYNRQSDELLELIPLE